MAEPSREFIGTQLDRLTSGVAGLREDMAVVTSFVLRRDATPIALLTEVRATHAQNARMADGVRRLETQE